MKNLSLNFEERFFLEMYNTNTLVGAHFKKDRKIFK